MKSLVTILSTLLLVSTAFANNYAPTLQTVVVIHDIMEEEYSPFLFQTIFGELLDLGMDESCRQIQVSSDKSVFCVSALNKVVAVGKLGTAQEPIEGWGINSVNWNSNVSIVKKSKNGKTIYSLVVTP